MPSDRRSAVTIISSICAQAGAIKNIEISKVN
jgi:hypothetical protein